MIIETQVWCHAGNRDLGLKDDDCWMPFAFDTEELTAVKECGENDFLGKGKASIWLRGGHDVTIEMDFVDILQKWKESRGHIIHENQFGQKRTCGSTPG